MQSQVTKLPVLIVDDNKHACRLLTAILGAVTTGERQACDSPSQAYELLQSWKPGLIITDYRMQPIDGLAFARELRTNPVHNCRHLPILMMTGETPNQVLVQEVKSAGIDAMVTKPIAPDMLVARMNWALNSAAQRIKRQRADSSLADPSHSKTNTWIVD